MKLVAALCALVVLVYSMPAVQAQGDPSIEASTQYAEAEAAVAAMHQAEATVREAEATADLARDLYRRMKHYIAERSGMHEYRVQAAESGLQKAEATARAAEFAKRGPRLVRDSLSRYVKALVAKREAEAAYEAAIDDAVKSNFEIGSCTQQDGL